MLLIFLAAVTPLAAQYSLYTSMATTKGFVVGAKLLPSGVFKRTPAGEWRQVGFSHPFVFSLDYDPRDPARIYVAAGNGILRVDSGERSWTITTSQDITEARDVSVDRDGAVYFGYSAGIRVSRDGGHLAGTRGQSETEVHRNDSRRPRASGGGAGRNRERIVPNRGRGLVLAAGWRGRLSGAVHQPVATRCLPLACHYAGRRIVRVAGLRQELRKLRRTWGRSQPLRHRL